MIFVVVGVIDYMEVGKLPEIIWDEWRKDWPYNDSSISSVILYFNLSMIWTRG